MPFILFTVKSEPYMLYAFFLISSMFFFFSICLLISSWWSNCWNCFSISSIGFDFSFFFLPLSVFFAFVNDLLTAGYSIDLCFGTMSVSPLASFVKGPWDVLLFKIGVTLLVLFFLSGDLASSRSLFKELLSLRFLLMFFGIIRSTETSTEFPN